MQGSKDATCESIGTVAIPTSLLKQGRRSTIQCTEEQQNQQYAHPALDKKHIPPPHTLALPKAAMPFMGEYRGCVWNAQALFASDATLQTDKHRHAWSLLAKVDFAGFAETHSTTGHTEAASLPNNCKFFWSHGPTRWQAGVGLGVKTTFLQQTVGSI